MNHPAMKDMDPLKLELIKTAAAQTAGKSGNSLAPVLLSLITNANKQGIRFSPEEMNLILDLMKSGKPKKEQDQIDKTVNMVSSLLKTKK